jgi:hypothetical protein
MAAPKAPAGLAAGGKALWSAVVAEHDLDQMQLVQLEEACRAKDRCDKFDDLLRGDIETWCHLTHRTMREDYELVIDSALTQANATANLMKQLLASLRLPDKKTGQRPQQRGGARGAYKTGGGESALGNLRALAGGKVS